MYKLNNIDATFLHMETARTPMHIASVQVMELPAGVSEQAFIDGLLRFLLQRIERVPYLTNRLQSSPLEVDQPIWVRAEDFDIQRHVYRVQVPAPGGTAELEATVAELHEQPLDRAHPLWECAVLCGLANGRVAYYNRVHHACIDGLAGQAATMLLMDPSPEPKPGDTSATPVATHWGDYDNRLLWLAAAEHFARSAIDLASSSLGVLHAAARVAQRALHPDKGYGAAFERAPRTRFNRPVTSARTFAVGELPLTDVKAVAKTVGCTVNDVFLAACSGALRRYFERLQEHPKTPLLAGCPVSLRHSAGGTQSNAVALMKVSLGSHLGEPLQRLAHIQASTIAGKGLLAEAVELIRLEPALPGLPLLQQTMARWSETLGLSEWLDPGVNLIVSNVPGPRKVLYSNGAKMLTHYPVSVPAHGTGVNITVQSYVDGLYFSVTACRRALPDAGVLRNDVLAAFAELCAALPSAVLTFERKGAAAPSERGYSAGLGSNDDKSARVA